MMTHLSIRTVDLFTFVRTLLTSCGNETKCLRCVNPTQPVQKQRAATAGARRRARRERCENRWYTQISDIIPVVQLPVTWPLRIKTVPVFVGTYLSSCDLSVPEISDSSQIGQRLRVRRIVRCTSCKPGTEIEVSVTKTMNNSALSYVKTKASKKKHQQGHHPRRMMANMDVTTTTTSTKTNGNA